MRMSFSRPRAWRNLTAALLALLPLVAACESAESKQMKAIAGNYGWTYESEIAPGQQQPWVTEQHTLTLRPDGRWVSKVVRTISGEEATFADSGSYRVQGTTLALGATEQGPASQFTISGDTLWSNASGKIAIAEAVTGLKVKDTGEQSFFVRER